MIAAALAAVLLGPADLQASDGFPDQCGKYRWPVKTLTDRAAANVDLNPRPTSVARLRKLKLHPDKLTSTTPRLPVETKTRTIKDVRLRRFSLAEDQDIHLVVAGKSGRTMIVEFLLPACTERANHPVYKPGARDLMTQARAALAAACGQPSPDSFTKLRGRATITGVVFSDFVHGQAGVAPNGVELHPVTAFASRSCRHR